MLALNPAIGKTDEGTVQVKDVEGLIAALDNAKGHSGDSLEIVLDDGDYRTGASLKLIAASKVRISAKKGARIVSTCPEAVLVLAYCKDVQISRLTLRHDPAPSGNRSLDGLVRIDHCEGVQLKECNLELTSPQAMKTAPPAVKKFLGDEILDIVSKPDKILSFRIKPKKVKKGTEVKAEEVLGVYPIVESGPTLTAAQSKVLIGVILDEKTYNFEAAKRGFMVPQYGFKFFRGDKEVGLLVDVYRLELQFIFDGETKKDDFDAAEQVVRALLKDIFPANPPDEIPKG